MSTATRSPQPRTHNPEPRQGLRIDLLEKVRRAIATHQLLPAGTRIVVAVSGGADSVALLHALVALRPEMDLTLAAAHLDHGLRETSQDDAQSVGRLGQQLGVPTTIERRPVAEICEREGWSLEEGARLIRYHCLLDVAHRFSAGHVAVAHTADDQAETVLMRLLRGAGLTGLSAIPVKRQLEDVWIIRPLLEIWRRDILSYLAEHGLPYCEDATNQDRRFLRNRIRHELLPFLERDYNPNVKAALVQLAEQSRCDDAFLQSAASRQWKRLAKRAAETQVALKTASFRQQPLALQRQMIRQTIQSVRGDLRQFEFRHWVEIEQLITQRPVGTVVHLPGGVEAQRGRETVMFRSSSPVPLARGKSPRYTDVFLTQ